MRKFLLFIFVYTCSNSFLQGQVQKTPSLVYMDASSLELIGQAFPLKSYHRIDTSLYPAFPTAVKKLLTNSAGLVISFKTKSSRIAAQWCVTNSKPGNNMTPIANKGLDLYIKQGGNWKFAGVGRPNDVCNEYVLVQNMDNTEKECLLYLPLYDELKNLKIGVDSGYQVLSGINPFKRKVVIYGSSITQGASASRPGMAYPARLSRDMGINFINLGLSGNGKMEKEVADMLATIEADAFVLDCFANPSPEQITQRTAYLVKAIRAKHPNVPIIIIQSVIREAGNFDQKVRENVRMQNENALREYQKLKQEGVKNLHIIKGDVLLGQDHEGTTDGVHPNDLGFDRMFQIIKPEMIRILQPLL